MRSYLLDAEMTIKNHRWSDDGETCLDCGDKDWMGGSCNAAPMPTVTPSQWQPIETAPRDGKRFLCATIIPNHRLVIAMRGVAGILLDEDCQPLPFPMTHWMPLPARPEVTT